MNFMEERIIKDGIVKPGNVLKVDSFLNHQMDIELMDQMGMEFKRRFANKNITKILTIEASGIAIACMTARHFGVPVVFTKKAKSVNVDGEVPIGKSIPFGLQHVLAMFVANIAPIMIVAGACGLTATDTATLIQTAMIIAGIGTFVQIFPIWRIGSRLSIVMGISFTFVSIFCYIGPKYGYSTVIGAIIVGSIVEGLISLH